MRLPLSHATALLLSCLSASPAAAQAISAPVGAIEDAAHENKPEAAPPPDVAEYKDVPAGILISPDADTKPAPAPETAPPSLGQLPGVYRIPGADGAQDADSDRALTMDEIASAYKRGNYAVVLKNLEPMAEHGQHAAEELLAIMHLNGQGVEKNPEKAFALMQRAAEGNQTIAQHYLGVMHFSGTGTGQPDPIQALKWLHIAILHYPDGPEKDRAKKDRDNVYLKMARFEKTRALEMARDWLGKRGEAHLLDMR